MYTKKAYRVKDIEPYANSAFDAQMAALDAERELVQACLKFRDLSAKACEASYVYAEILEAQVKTLAQHANTSAA